MSTSSVAASARAQYEPEAVGICVRCFGPLEPVYDWDALHGRVTHESIARGPRSLWRYADLLPAVNNADPLSPGFTPLVEAPRLARELGVGSLLLKLDIANPTHSFKDRVVAVAAAKAVELGLGTLACSSTGNLASAVAARAAAEGLNAIIFCANTVEREKLAAASVYGARIYTVRGSYDDCSRLASELDGEVDWGFVNNNLRAYYAEGSKTLAFEVAEQLGWELPDVVVSPVASGSLLTKIWQGFDQLRLLDLVRRRGAADHRRPGCRLLAGGGRVRRGPAGLARAPRHDRAVAGDRQPGRRRPRRRDGARRRAAGSTTCPEDEVGENMQLLAETTGVFGETAAGVTLGALRAAVAAGTVGGPTASCCSSRARA